jgi:hypothetical protein
MNLRSAKDIWPFSVLVNLRLYISGDFVRPMQTCTPATFIIPIVIVSALLLSVAILNK